MVEYESDLFDRHEEKIEPIVTVKNVLDTFKPCDSISAGSVVANGIVYFGANNGYIHAVDANSGEMKWKYPTGGVILASCVVHNGVLYIGSFDQYFYAIDAKSGEIKWRFRTNERLAAGATITDDCIYLGAIDSYLYCLSHDGELLWRFKTGDGIAVPPLIVNDIIIFGSCDGSLYAIKDCQKMWNFIAKGPVLTSTLINEHGNTIAGFEDRVFRGDTRNGLLCFGDAGGNYYGISFESGELKWSIKLGGMSLGEVVYNGVIFVSTQNGYIHALSADNGGEVWKFRSGGVNTIPIVFNNTLYFGSNDRNIYAFSLDGELLWRYHMGGEIDAPMHISKGVLYFGSWDGMFRAFDLKERKIIWEFKVGSATAKPMYTGLLERAWSITRVIRNIFWRPDPKIKGSIYEKPEMLSSNVYSMHNPYETKETTYTQKTEYEMKKKKR